MAEISKIKIGSTTYDIKDAVARAAAVGGVHYIGITTTALTDKATTSPVTIDSKEVTPKAGDIVIYVSGDKHLEFIWNASATPAHWDEFGSTGELGTAAFMDYEETNLEHTHTISHTPTTANVSFGTGAKTASVVTSTSLSSKDFGTGDFDYISSVTVNDTEAKGSIIVPDAVGGDYTPEGTVGLNSSTVETTEGGVKYGSTNSTTTITPTTVGHTHTASLSDKTIKFTANGSVNYDKIKKVTPSFVTDPVFEGNSESLIKSGTTTSVVVDEAKETLTIPASVITALTSTNYKPAGTINNTTLQASFETESTSTGVNGIEAEVKDATVSVGTTTVTVNPVALPALSFTNPKYIKITDASFAGTKKAFTGTTSYSSNLLYAKQYKEGNYKNYDNSPDGAALPVPMTMAVVPNSKAIQLSVTSGQVAVSGLTGSVTYDKANTPTGSALAKTVKVLKTKA